MKNEVPCQQNQLERPVYPALGGMLFITVFVVLFSTASSVLGSADQMLSRL